MPNTPPVEHGRDMLKQQFYKQAAEQVHDKADEGIEFDHGPTMALLFQMQKTGKLGWGASAEFSRLFRTSTLG